MQQWLGVVRETRPRSRGGTKTGRERAGKIETTMTGHFGYREITWLSWRHRFRKTPFSKWFPSTWKRKVGFFKFLRFDERFRKAPFSRRISVDRRLGLTVEIKLRFQIYPGHMILAYATWTVKLVLLVLWMVSVCHQFTCLSNFVNNFHMDIWLLN